MNSASAATTLFLGWKHSRFFTVNISLKTKETLCNSPAYVEPAPRVFHERSLGPVGILGSSIDKQPNEDTSRQLLLVKLLRYIFNFTIVVNFSRIE